MEFDESDIEIFPLRAGKIFQQILTLIYISDVKKLIYFKQSIALSTLLAVGLVVPRKNKILIFSHFSTTGLRQDLNRNTNKYN